MAADAWCRTQQLADLPWRPGPVRRGRLAERQRAFWGPFIDALPTRWRDTFAAGVISDGRPGGPRRPRSSRGPRILRSTGTRASR
jgi:hypothetical protein